MSSDDVCVVYVHLLGGVDEQCVGVLPSAPAEAGGGLQPIALRTRSKDHNDGMGNCGRPKDHGRGRAVEATKRGSKDRSGGTGANVVVFEYGQLLITLHFSLLVHRTMSFRVRLHRSRANRELTAEVRK